MKVLLGAVILAIYAAIIWPYVSAKPLPYTTLLNWCLESWLHLVVAVGFVIWLLVACFLSFLGSAVCGPIYGWANIWSFLNLLLWPFWLIGLGPGWPPPKDRPLTGIENSK